MKNTLCAIVEVSGNSTSLELSKTEIPFRAIANGRGQPCRNIRDTEETQAQQTLSDGGSIRGMACANRFVGAESGSYRP
jgi:hypothetical protein